jgi:hypothetical protein
MFNKVGSLYRGFSNLKTKKNKKALIDVVNYDPFVALSLLRSHSFSIKPDTINVSIK